MELKICSIQPDGHFDPIYFRPKILILWNLTAIIMIMGYKDG